MGRGGVIVGRMVTLTGIVLLALQAQAAQPVSVTGAWARATAPGQPVGAAYLSMTAPAMDELLSITSPDAEGAMLHRSTEKDGVAGMEDMDTLKLRPAQTIRLAPRGLHVMLMGLRHPLVAGGHVTLDLHFRRAGTERETVPVLPLGAAGP